MKSLGGVVSALFCSFILQITALDNGLGKTPLLGFNSWNIFACHVNESVLIDTMDLFVSLGLKDLGYNYVSVDDCWAQSRDPKTNVIIPDPVAFPHGMKYLADYAHSKGLKFGLYSSNSPNTCAGRPGSFGYEIIDAATYASWGVDLLKYDNCGDQNIIGPPQEGYSVMRDALNATGRPIYFAACEWAVDFPATWMNPVANSWRTTYDIQNLWECVVPHVDWTNVYSPYARPGGFNDMDILEVGNGVLTYPESITHFSLWAIMKSPLQIGCNLKTVDPQFLNIMKNKELIDINQDALGVQAKRVWSSGDQGVPRGKSGTCGSEELPQNTIIAPCNAGDPYQVWSILSSNGSIRLPVTGECLQLDSGQSGCCGQLWNVWTNNVASSMCGDPSSCCGSRQELWYFDSLRRAVHSNVTGQCLAVHAGGYTNVGTTGCGGLLSAFQVWDYNNQTGQFVSGVTPPGASGTYCLSRTKDVRGGATEVWSGPLTGGDVVVLLFNRNVGGPTNITATWGMLGLGASEQFKVRDLWQHVDLGIKTGSLTASVDVHGSVVFRLTRVSN